MKKFLALALAVICIFSMATVAFAVTYPNVCKICGATFDSADEAMKHNEVPCDRICPYCETRCETTEKRDAHIKECQFGSQKCDYCGKDFCPIKEYDAHLEDCKAKYFNIPVAKIFATVKDLFSKIDWSSVLGTVKDLGGKLTGLLGNIGK